MNDTSLAQFHKPTLSRGRRAFRAVASVLDPRAYVHAFRMLNHYNTTHVTPRRTLVCGGEAAISPTAQFAHASRITLGVRCRIGSGCILWAGPGHGEIITGDDLLLGPNVLITAANYRFRDGSPVTDQAMREKTVTLGHDIWIGAGAIILPGTHIGDGAIIAAGAVVRDIIPAASIAAGVPARIVGQR